MPVLVTCSECGDGVRKSPSQIREHSFCDPNCYHAWAGKRQRKPVLTACSWCGKSLIVSPSEVHTRYGNFCSRGCVNRYRALHRRGEKGKSPSEQTRMKIASSLKGKITYVRTPTTKEKMRQRARELNYVERLRKGQCKPNRIESALLKLLDEHAPGEWRYTGDGSFVIGHFMPDYVNCNGRKLIIELFGDYWHAKEDIEIKEKAYKEFGYGLLVIWEHELKDEPAVVAKVKEFMERSCCENES